MAAVGGITVRVRGRKLFHFNAARFILFCFLALLLLFTSLPLIYVVTTAFKPLDELFIYPPKFFAKNPTLTNFGDLFSALDNTVVPFTRYVFNSVFLAVAQVVLIVLVSVMCAYGMVKIHPKGSDLLFTVIIMALSFSGPVTQIPSFLIIKELHLLDSYWALILPKIASAFSVFLVKQFMEQMPDAYIEAARMDGASEWQIFWRIVMPYVRPAWATVVVFSFVGNWNDYFSPLIYLTDESLKTMPLAIQNIAGGAGAASLATAGAMTAATFCMTLPTIIIYTAMQSKVISTMSHSGIKA